MKKALLCCIIATLISGLYLTGWSAYHFSQGDNVIAYTRFQAKEAQGKESHFNFYGLLLPIQVEAQHLTTKTKHFTARIPYPCADKFVLIPPVDSFAEARVAEKIIQIIKDSSAKMQIEYGIDYDGTSAGVRTAAQPRIVTVNFPKARIELAVGTASPEAIKYGFEKSIQPEAFEVENAQIARERLERSVNILADSGYATDSMTSMELQFPDSASAAKAIADPSLLDAMRYVEVHVVGTIQEVHITTQTAPLFLPLLLFLSFLGLTALYRLFNSKKSGTPHRWRNIIAAILMYSALIISIITLIVLIWLFWNTALILAILAILALCALCIALWVLIRYGSLQGFLEICADLFTLFLLAIVAIFEILWIIIVALFDGCIGLCRRLRVRFLICWRALPRCWKRVFLFVLVWAITMTIIVIRLV